jgi:anti-sigma factor RsiW
MNCEKYQELISDLVDGVLTAEDCQTVELHLSTCPGCADAHGDLRAIVQFCRENRGEYDVVPNERALWLRISNTLEAENPGRSRANVPSGAGWWFRLMNRSWQLSFPQLAGAVAGLILLVSLATVVSVRNLATRAGVQTAGPTFWANNVSLEDRYRQQEQAIAYWNERVELNKARWNPQMRETFDRNMSVIDAAVNDSMKQLRQNPHDEISEEILNDALSDKVALLKEFSDL